MLWGEDFLLFFDTFLKLGQLNFAHGALHNRGNQPIRGKTIRMDVLAQQALVGAPCNS